MNGDRLTALDSSFLHLEDAASHMHVASVTIFEGSPPSYAEFLEHIEARLSLVPRFRQKLRSVPLNQGRPVWVDDPHFNLEYHVRATALPPPGSEQQLKNLASRVFAQQLDRTKPLWEIWLIEGLENGTRILFAAAVDAYAVAENRLARLVVPRLTKGMLCLADRGFFGYELWNQAVATGADLLWRVKSTLKPGPLERLPDGSYLGRLRRGTKPVRIIKFTLTFNSGKCEHYRLITTILDYHRAPAAELARLYARRWKIETMFDELKVRIGGPKLLLRSATPDLVEQDVYGLLLAHFGIRHEIIGAAREQGFDPEEVSFVNALHVIIRRLPEMVSFSPSAETALP